MITAEIYFHDTMVTRIAIDSDRPPFYIRERAQQPLSIMDYADSELMMQQVEMKIWVYSLKNRTGPFSWRYDFDGEQSIINFAHPEGNIMDFGFNEEPNDKVNLDKLISKFKKNTKVIQLLKNYFQRS